MKYNIKSNSQILKVSSSSVLAGIMLATTFASCSKIDKETVIPESESTYTYESITTSKPTSSFATPSDVPSESVEEEVYSFAWEHDETEDFEKLVREKFNVSIAKYICYYGFTDELNVEFTNFINNRFKTEYKSVPFKKANYFFDYIMRGDSTRHYYDNYDKFVKVCLRNDISYRSAYNNKLIFSYLYYNNIVFGENIQLDRFKEFMGNELYEYGGEQRLTTNDLMLGNYDDSHLYSKYELLEILQVYNTCNYTLCADNSIKTRDLFEKTEVIELHNQHLKTFYGENAPQLGQTITLEQYRAMFGEDPLDLSYIPGAVVNDSQVKGNAQVRYGV
ncbi:MAG: hypothetical protein K5875_10270 [Saccharofermentans sp.]|nr:hypothetical protein [Saccharofermentans sp.]